MTKKIPGTESIMTINTNTNYVGVAGLHSENNYNSTAGKTHLDIEFTRKLKSMDKIQNRVERKNARTKRLLERSMLAYTERMRQISRKRMAISISRYKRDDNDVDELKSIRCDPESVPSIHYDSMSESVSPDCPSRLSLSSISENRLSPIDCDHFRLSPYVKDETVFPLTGIKVRFRGHSVAEGCLYEIGSNKNFRKYSSVTLPPLRRVGKVDNHSVPTVSSEETDRKRRSKLQSEQFSHLHRKYGLAISPFETISEEMLSKEGSSLTSNEE